jgi:hypothetical protein
MLALAGPLAAADQDNVRIYRCTSSNGLVALQNAPCGDGRQQVLDMQRPKDPPPRPASAASAKAAPPVPVREVRIVSVQPPQPMYECVSPEGERYTSNSAEGNPRWVPTWVYGYPAGRPGAGPAHPSPARPSGPGNRPASGGVIVPYGSVQIRDECHALPPREVCARLADRRWELIQRYNSALQSERERLMREQRGIEARMDQDCGGA